MSTITTPQIVWIPVWCGARLARYDGKQGAYPYDCGNKQQHPNAMVYLGSEGDWFTGVGQYSCLAWRAKGLDDVPFPSPEALAEALAMLLV